MSPASLRKYEQQDSQSEAGTDSTSDQGIPLPEDAPQRPMNYAQHSRAQHNSAQHSRAQHSRAQHSRAQQQARRPASDDACTQHSGGVAAASHAFVGDGWEVPVAVHGYYQGAEYGAAIAYAQHSEYAGGEHEQYAGGELAGYASVEHAQSAGGEHAQYEDGEHEQYEDGDHEQYSGREHAEYTGAYQGYDAHRDYAEDADAHCYDGYAAHHAVYVHPGGGYYAGAPHAAYASRHSQDLYAEHYTDADYSGYAGADYSGYAGVEHSDCASGDYYAEYGHTDCVRADYASYDGAEYAEYDEHTAYAGYADCYERSATAYCGEGDLLERQWRNRRRLPTVQGYPCPSHYPYPEHYRRRLLRAPGLAPKLDAQGRSLASAMAPAMAPAPDAPLLPRSTARESERVRTSEQAYPVGRPRHTPRALAKGDSQARPDEAIGVQVATSAGLMATVAALAESRGEAAGAPAYDHV